MMQVAAGRRVAVVSAALALILYDAPALAQSADQAPPPADPLDPGGELDPSAPLDPMPDIGVDWPDMADDPNDEIPDIPATTIADAAQQRRYDVAIEGLEEIEADGLRAQFAELSVLEANRGDPANAAQVDRRARADAELMAELLRAYGYYDAGVETRVQVRPEGGLLVTIDVVPGPLYRFAEVSLPGVEAAGADAPALREAFRIDAQDPVDAASVAAGEAALRVELGRRGYAFAEVGPMDIAVDHATRSATLTLPVRPEGARRFGRVLVEGRALLSAGHIETIARFDEGDPYRAALIQDLRQALVATGLVSSATIRPVARAGTDYVDLAVALEQAPLRTIAGEAGYGTGEGVRVELSWQHRNLLPPEGAVTFRGVLGTREQLLGAVLRRNNFLERDQVLTAQIVASRVDREAYQANSFIMAAALERHTNLIWQKAWTWSIGAELITSGERDVDLDSGTIRERVFYIGALPATLAYDGSDDLLDPTRGFRLAGRFSPEASFQGTGFGYARAQIDASAYHPVTPDVVLAGRTRIGTILGASRDRIAPSRRFYAGGGGSVRGYGFQRLGPRDPVFDDPIGGRGLVEFALEARVRTPLFDRSLSVVPFIDAGNISTSSLPGLDDLRFGAGVGVRYHTSFGPIRVDVATPLNPQSGDPRVAVYVSLGQAF